MQTTIQTITWFHKLLAAIWICGLIGLGLGISTSTAGTDRHIRSEVGLLRKPMTTASKWLINKQIKGMFGIETQAAGMVVNDPLNLILQNLKFVWEKAWQQAILSFALKLLSAVFKIVEQFVNKLLDMITSIGNIGAILSPFISAVTRSARTGFTKVKVCAEYWARRELQGILPDVDTGADDRKCLWLNEKISQAEIDSSDADTIAKIESKFDVMASSGDITEIEREDLFQTIGQIEKNKIEKGAKGECDGDGMDALGKTLFLNSGSACLDFSKIEKKQKVDEKVSQKRAEADLIGGQAKQAVQDQIISGGSGNDNLAILPQSGIDTLSKKEGKQKPKTWPKEFCNRIDPKSPELYCPISLDKINSTEENLRLAGLRSTQTPQPSGGVQGAFQNITEEFSKMLTDMLTKLFENTILGIFDFIADKILSGINAFLGKDSIFGGLGLDTLASETIGGLRDGIKNSIGGGRDNNSTGTRIDSGSSIPTLDCPNRIYWESDGREFAYAKEKPECTTVGMRFQDNAFESGQWCKTWNNAENFSQLISNVSRLSNPADSNGQDLIERTCRQRGLLPFELKTTP